MTWLFSLTPKNIECAEICNLRQSNGFGIRRKSELRNLRQRLDLKCINLIANTHQNIWIAGKMCTGSVSGRTHHQILTHVQVSALKFRIICINQFLY